MASFLRLHPTDNVVVAVNGLSPGDIVDDVKITRRIPRGHKMAVRPIAKGEPVLKFGQIIGFATQDIAPGDWVHEHNCGLHAFERDYAFAEGRQADAVLPSKRTRPSRASAAPTARSARATTSAS